MFQILTAEQVMSRLKGRKYKYAQVHHTWKPDHSDFDGKNHIELQQGMYNYHTKVRKWSDIGQHLTLMPDGKFVTGRDFGKTPAGIYGYNTDAFMIEILGNFDVGHDRLDGDQYEAALKVYHYLINECGAVILFHREKAAKSCPGTSINKDEFLYDVITYKKIKEGVKGVVKFVVLRNGDKGEQVKNLQSDLMKLGYALPKYGADGDFGTETEAAVKKMQQDNKLVVDGIAGPQTLGKIEELLKPKEFAEFTLGGKKYRITEV